MLHIKRFSFGSIVVAMILAVVFALIAIYGVKDLRELEETTDQYILCEKSAQKLQKGSDILTEQVRLYVITGQQEYMDGYFHEANVDKHRERAVTELEVYFANTQILSELQHAMQESKALMETEIYAMRLMAQAKGQSPDALPEAVQSVALSPADLALTAAQQEQLAQRLVFDDKYQQSKGCITDNVSDCMADLTELARDRQKQASQTFESLYLKQGVGFALLVIYLVVVSVSLHRLVVKPLMRFSSSMERDEPVPVEGAAELRPLAETYNRVLAESQKTQCAIRHQAEHDALSGLLNKGAFDKALAELRQAGTNFALLLADIDRFKLNLENRYSGVRPVDPEETRTVCRVGLLHELPVEVLNKFNLSPEELWAIKLLRSNKLDWRNESQQAHEKGTGEVSGYCLLRISCAPAGRAVGWSCVGKTLKIILNIKRRCNYCGAFFL